MNLFKFIVITSKLFQKYISIFFSRFSNVIIDYELDKNKSNDTHSCKKLKSHYRSDLFSIFVKRVTFLVCHFQRWLCTDVFREMFNNFKPGIDYNSQYIKIVNEHYLSSTED